MVLKLPGIGFSLVFSLFAVGCSDLAGSPGEPSSTYHGLPKTDRPATLLTPSTRTIDLGFVPQAGQQQHVFSLANQSTAPVEVARVETSCDCLTIALTRRHIRPGEIALVQVRLDLAKEQEFLGSLGIEVKGLTGSGTVAFSVAVELSVRPRDEFDTKEDTL